MSVKFNSCAAVLEEYDSACPFRSTTQPKSTLSHLVKLESACFAFEQLAKSDLRQILRSIRLVEELNSDSDSRVNNDTVISEFTNGIIAQLTMVGETIAQIQSRVFTLESSTIRKHCTQLSERAVLAGSDYDEVANDRGLPCERRFRSEQLSVCAISEAHTRLTPFSGLDGTPFSSWLRRFQDFADIQTAPWNDAEKATRLKFYLEGYARETFEELPAADKQSFNLAAAALTATFESPKMRSAARQSLSRCFKTPNETVAEFASRLRQLVRAATVGQASAVVKTRLLDEFVDRLQPDELAEKVKLTDPQTFEEALFKAKQVEDLYGASSRNQQQDDEMEFLKAQVEALRMQNERLIRFAHPSVLSHRDPVAATQEEAPWKKAKKPKSWI